MMHAAAIGPNMNPPSISISPDRSKDKNGGMNGIGKRNSISTALTAPIRPINAIFFTFILASSRLFRFSPVVTLVVSFIWFILNPPQKNNPAHILMSRA